MRARGPPRSQARIRQGLAPGIAAENQEAGTLPFYRLIQSYFCDLQGRGRLLTTKEIPLHAGVQQGSVIAPTFFLITADDLPIPSDSFISLGQYADDTTL